VQYIYVTYICSVIIKQLENMTTLNKITETLKNVSVEELKKVAIAYKDDVTNEGFLIAEKVNDLLMSKMADGEFAKFAETELF